MARLDYVMGGFVILTIVILGGTLMIGDLDDSYTDVNMTGSNDSFGDVYNSMDEMYNLSQDINEKALKSDISNTQSWESMTGGAYSALRLIPKTFEMFHRITNAVAIEFGLSCSSSGMGRARTCMFIDLFFLLFVISVVFAIIYMIFRFIPR